MELYYVEINNKFLASYDEENDSMQFTSDKSIATKYSHDDACSLGLILNTDGAAVRVVPVNKN